VGSVETSERYDRKNPIGKNGFVFHYRISFVPNWIYRLFYLQRMVRAMKRLLLLLTLVLMIGIMGCSSEQEEKRTIEGWAIYEAIERYGDNALITVETYDYMWIDGELQDEIFEQDDSGITVCSQIFKITMTNPDNVIDQETVYYVCVMWKEKWWHSIAEPRYLSEEDILEIDSVEAIE